VTAQGSSRSVFKRAIERGNLPMAEMTARAARLPRSAVRRRKSVGITDVRVMRLEVPHPRTAITSNGLPA